MRKTRVAVAGCGSVSRWSYLPSLSKSKYVELVAVADVNEKAVNDTAAQYRIPGRYTDARAMIRDERFDLFVNLTSMPFHAPLSIEALNHGKHVWCEKPMATTLSDARMVMAAAKRNRRIFLAAPFMTSSPAYRALKKLIDAGTLGKVCQIRARYGHGARFMWADWFFKKGGGSLFDLGVYNVMTLTGLLGPAKAVVAMSGIAIPVRTLNNGRKVRAEVEDNTILTLDFGQSRFGVIQTGFTFEKVDGGGGHHADMQTPSIEVIGFDGSARMLGYDWAPGGIEVGLRKKKGWQLIAKDQGAWSWQGGAAHLAECLATGKKPVQTMEHAYHVEEIMLSAIRSAKTGRRIRLTSTF